MTYFEFEARYGFGIYAKREYDKKHDRHAVSDVVTARVPVLRERGRRVATMVDGDGVRREYREVDGVLMRARQDDSGVPLTTGDLLAFDRNERRHACDDYPTPMAVTASGHLPAFEVRSFDDTFAAVRWSDQEERRTAAQIGLSRQVVIDDVLWTPALAPAYVIDASRDGPKLRAVVPELRFAAGLERWMGWTPPAPSTADPWKPWTPLWSDNGILPGGQDLQAVLDACEARGLRPEVSGSIEFEEQVADDWSDGLVAFMVRRRLADESRHFGWNDMDPVARVALATVDLEAARCLREASGEADMEAMANAAEIVEASGSVVEDDMRGWLVRNDLKRSLDLDMAGLIGPFGLG